MKDIYLIRDEIFLSLDEEKIHRKLEELVENSGNVVDQKKSLECLVEYEAVIDDIIGYIKRKYQDSFIIPMIALNAILGIIRSERLYHEDKWHSIKRCYSFNYFDSFLSCCENGICPDIRELHIRYLVDISLECYITDRAYFYSVGDVIIGKDDVDRYYMATNKLNTVFNCRKKCRIKDSVFNLDFAQTNSIFNVSSLKRKAYWTYLSHRNDYNDLSNYYDACHFMEKQRYYFKTCDYLNYKEMIFNNLNKSNALDLFRLCKLNKCG